jgi:hypothetical protein
MRPIKYYDCLCGCPHYKHEYVEEEGQEYSVCTGCFCCTEYEPANEQAEEFKKFEAAGYPDPMKDNNERNI